MADKRRSPPAPLLWSETRTPSRVSGSYLCWWGGQEQGAEAVVVLRAPRRRSGLSERPPSVRRPLCGRGAGPVCLAAVCPCTA